MVSYVHTLHLKSFSELADCVIYFCPNTLPYAHKDPLTLPQISFGPPFHIPGSEKISALFASAIIIIFAFPVESLDTLTAFLLQAITKCRGQAGLLRATNSGPGLREPTAGCSLLTARRRYLHYLL